LDLFLEKGRIILFCEARTQIHFYGAGRLNINRIAAKIDSKGLNLQYFGNKSFLAASLLLFTVDSIGLFLK
jgi:hypothetical protein